MIGTLLYLGIGAWFAVEVRGVALAAARHEPLEIRWTVWGFSALAGALWLPLVAAYWLRRAAG